MQGQASETCSSRRHGRRQLRKLRNGTHPKTGASLPQAVELDPVIMPVTVNGNEVAHRPPDGFYVYVPAGLASVATAAAAGGPAGNCYSYKTLGTEASAGHMRCYKKQEAETEGKSVGKSAAEGKSA